MVHDARDRDRIFFCLIKNPISPVDQTANVFAQIIHRHADLRMIREAVERLIEAKEIGVGHVRTKLLNAVFADSYQIGASSRRDNDPSHGGQGTQS